MPELSRQQRRAAAHRARKRGASAYDEWTAAQERAAEMAARHRDRAQREGCLAEYEADPWAPHPDDVRMCDHRLRAVLCGEDPQAAATVLLKQIAIGIGVSSHDDAHLAEGLIELGTALESAARTAGRLGTPFSGARLDASALGSGSLGDRVGSALSGFQPGVCLQCMVPLAGYAVAATVTGEPDLQRRLSTMLDEAGQHARRVFHLCQSFPGRATR